MIISSKNSCIKIISKTIDARVLKKDILNNNLIFKFIPDLGFAPRKKKIILRIENKNKLKIKFSLKKPFIYGRYQKDFSSTDIIVLCEYLLERLRQEDGICSFHSSSVYKKNKAILFFANLTGAGKTSVALYLHKKYKYKIFSDEKTLIDIKKIKLVGQTKKIFLEEKTKKTLGSFNLKFPSVINVKKTGNKDCCLLIIPVIVKSASIPIVFKYKPNQLEWSLYEEVSKDVRLINGLIFNLSYPLPSLDNHQLASKRKYFIKIISQKIPCYYVLGKLSDVAREVDQIFADNCLNS